MYNYDLFLKLTRDVSEGLDKTKKIEKITLKCREIVTERDDLTCKICGLQDEHGRGPWGKKGIIALHHIIPTGESSPENIVSLCKYCKNAVNLVLYRSGKWKYIRAF
ncbi:MAG: HNH endonuclease [Methanoregula sp.]|nr:HNH endonuclease [Methanoregula sp.]